MSRRSPIILITTTLALFAGVIGFLVGQRAGLTESLVIAHAADLWVAQTGGQATDCAGRPGTGAVWIAVTCGAGVDAVTYMFDASGYLIDPSQEPHT